MIMMTKWSPASGMYKGRSFDEQKDVTERWSILFNPTDFCLVVFSGDSQQTRHIKKSHFKGGGLFNSVLCCPERLRKAQATASDEHSLFLPGNLWSSPVSLRAHGYFLQLLFFSFTNSQDLAGLSLQTVQYQSTRLKRRRLVQPRDV